MSTGSPPAASGRTHRSCPPRQFTDGVVDPAGR
jgi:hypothetical protein